MAARARLRARVRVPPRARAMNLRRWLTARHRREALAADRVRRPAADRRRRRARPAPGDRRPQPVGHARPDVIDVVTLQWLPYQLRGLIAGALGATLFLYGAYRLIRALVDPFEAWDGEQPMVEVIYQKRFLARGPRVVAIGGGTGLSTLLRGLKEHTSNLTAVVTVADDGGSSGVLRTELGIPAVGDIRNCIVALADAEPLMGRLLQYRFPGASPAVDGPRPVRRRPAAARSLETRRRRRRASAATPSATCCSRPWSQLEQGDFEEARARDEPRARGARPGRAGDGHRDHAPRAARRRHRGRPGQSRIARTNRVDRVWVTPEDVQPDGRRARRRSPTPSSSSSARAACSRASCPRSWCPGSARRSRRPARWSCSCATWPRSPARPAASTSRTTSTRSPATAPATCRTSCSPTTGSTRTRRAAGWAQPVQLRWPPTKRPGIRLVLDDARGPRERPPPRSGPPRHRRHRRVGARGRPPPATARGPRGPDGLSAGRAEPDVGHRPGPRRGAPRRARRGRPVPAVRPAGRDRGPRVPRSRPASRRWPGSSSGSAGARWTGRCLAPRPPTPTRGPTWAAGPAGCSSCPRSRSSGRRSAEHCRTAWLRGRFLARGSLSLAGGHAHLEFVVPVERGGGARAAAGRRSGCPRVAACAGATASSPGRARSRSPTFLGRIGASASLLELEARQVARSLRGELNRVLNAESANLQRSVAASGRQLAAIDALEADGRLGEQPRTVRAVAEARRETPEASLSEIATRLDLHRSAVQRALDRLERLALHDDEGVGRRARTGGGRRREPQPAGDGDRSLTADAAGPNGHGRGRRLWHDQADAPDRDRRQLEDEHDAGRCRRARPHDRVADARAPASPGSSARRSCASPPVRDALAGEDVGRRRPERPPRARPARTRARCPCRCWPASRRG